MENCNNYLLINIIMVIFVPCLIGFLLFGFSEYLGKKHKHDWSTWYEVPETPPPGRLFKRPTQERRCHGCGKCQRNYL